MENNKLILTEMFPSVHKTYLKVLITYLIRETVTALEEKNWKIQLTWVKAHVGLYGNEMADKLAK